MENLMEKTFINKQLGFELTSYIDNKQNIWFRGKDVAKILGYSDTDQAIRKNVSTENKMFHLIHSKCSPVSTTGQQNVTRGKYCSPGVSPGQQNKTKGPETGRQQNDVRGKCSPVSTTGQQNDIGGGETPPQQNDTIGKYCTLLMSLAFMNLYLVLN